MNAFFLSANLWPSHLEHEPIQLDGPEAQHMLKVLRLGAGERVWLFDGQGHSGEFEIVQTSKHKALLRAHTLQEHPRPSGQATLALGWAKAVRRGWLLEKAVEFETSAIWLWQAKHSQGRVPDTLKDTWQAQCVAGAKQSKNPWLPELCTLTGGARELAKAIPDFDRAYLLWEEPGQERVLGMEDLLPAGHTLFIVGPEGGFALDEVALLREAGALPVSLGQRVLRWETAAMLCLGLAWWTRQNTPALKDAGE